MSPNWEHLGSTDFEVYVVYKYHVRFGYIDWCLFFCQLRLFGYIDRLISWHQLRQVFWLCWLMHTFTPSNTWLQWSTEATSVWLHWSVNDFTPVNNAWFTLMEGCLYNWQCLHFYNDWNMFLHHCNISWLWLKHF